MVTMKGLTAAALTLGALLAPLPVAGVTVEAACVGCGTGASVAPILDVPYSTMPAGTATMRAARPDPAGGDTPLALACFGGALLLIGLSRPRRPLGARPFTG